MKEFEAWGMMFLTVLICIAVYTTFVKPYTPAVVQRYIGI